MKLINKFLLVIMLLNLVSCSTYSYFQVYEVKTENTNESTENLIFKNGDLTIKYNLWAQYGNESFYVYNKTDSNIFIDLGLSHFIINNNANTYYQYREWTKNRSTSLSSSNSNTLSTDYYYLSYPYNASKSKSIGVSTTSQNEITHIEKRIVVIPPHSQKKINGFILNNILFANCNISKYPKNNKGISKINFNLDNTLFTYENYLTYSFNENINEPRIIKNSFWIKEITFLPYKEFYKKIYDVNCGVKSTNSTLYYNYSKSNRFFIEYTKSSKFININQKKKSIKGSSNNNIDSNTKIKIGDKVLYKDAFNSINATVVKIDNKYYYIEYKNEKGIAKTKKVTKKWLKKIE